MVKNLKTWLQRNKIFSYNPQLMNHLLCFLCLKICVFLQNALESWNLVYAILPGPWTNLRWTMEIRVHSIVLTGVSVQTKQTEHTERKPRGTSVHHDRHQHTAAAPWLQKWTKIDISKCLLHVIYMSTYYTFSHRHRVISKSTVG